MGEAPEPRFEEAIAELEAVVARLEGGDLDLEEALRLFQRGMELARLCARQLDSAEKRVEMLIAEAGGEPVVKPFEDGEGARA
ncbi:MAG: exodeoxyribonuclease VII small subunit [Clostridia bacterium]|nr:exodeoxyribonuclease VII small subunit [Clostridia bacterium]